MRIHYLDWARALFMLLGVPYHAALVFATLGPWLIHDQRSSNALTLFADFTQIFRMPGFFFIAGFFAALLLSKRSTSAWFHDRLIRLGVPFITAIIVLNPVQLLIDALAHQSARGLESDVQALIQTHPDRVISHLWFLPCLILLCALLALSWRWLNRPTNIWKTLIGWLAGRAPALLWISLAVAVYLTLIESSIITLSASTKTWLGPIISAAEYAPWFLMGVAACQLPAFKVRLESSQRLAFITALISVPIYMIVHENDELPHAFLLEIISMPCAALSLMVIVLGLLRRFSDRPSAAIDKLVAASFTIYLFHQPFILLSAYMLLNIAMPPVLKWLMIVAFTLCASYSVHLLIKRSSMLQFLFNGVRKSKLRGIIMAK